MSLVIKAEDFDASKLEVKDPETKKGNIQGKITYDGHAQYLIQTEPVRCPFGVSIKENPWAKKDTDKQLLCSLAMEMTEEGPTRAVVESYREKLLEAAAEKPKLFLKTTKADIIEHAFSENIKPPKDEKYAHLLYGKVYLSDKGKPQLFAMYEDGTIDPSSVGPHSTCVVLLDMTNYWLKGGKEFGHSIYAKQVKVLEMGDSSMNVPMFLE